MSIKDSNQKPEPALQRDPIIAMRAADPIPDLTELLPIKYNMRLRTQVPHGDCDFITRKLISTYGDIGFSTCFEFTSLS